MSWYNSNWLYRHKITINKDKIDSNLTDKDVYINLDDLPDSFFASVKSDGGDIRITQSDGVTEQPRENVFIDTGTKKGELHLKSSSLSSSVDTVIYIYYGNSGASEPAADSANGSQNVWDGNTKAVYHLQEDPAGGAGSIKDSTATGAHGTPTGSFSSGDSVDGKLSGKAINFVNTNNNINITTDLSISQSITIEIWAYHDVQTGTYDHMIDNPSDWAISINGGNLHTFLDVVTSGGGWEDSGDAVSTGNWHHIALVYDHSSNMRYAYLNGIEVFSASASGDINQTGAQSINSGTSWFDGMLDEARIHNTNRSLAWLKATRENHNNTATFYTVGSQEIEAKPRSYAIII